MRLINIGFGNLVSSERLLTIVGPDSAPIKRMIQEARDRAIARRLADPSAEPEREEEEQA